MKNERLAIPSMETTFSINVQGKETGKYFEGTFTYRRANLHERAEIGAMVTRLGGDLKNLPYVVRNYNEMRAVLFHCLKSSPKWWEDSQFGQDFYDVNIVEEIYNKCMAFEDEQSIKVWGTKKEDVEEKSKVE